jgi:streptogramin lyase
MALGPDSKMWFVEGPGNRIGRIDPATATPGASGITEFSTGISPSSFPSDITTGPDQNLWFTVRNASRVDRITPSGAVTEFSTGITGPYAQGIAQGQDGNLWFTEPTGQMIGQITRAGVVTEFATQGTPHDIVAGPDGNLWFTEYFGDRIGQINPSTHVVTEFQATVGSNPFSIALGPDHALWFTEDGANRIGRIDPATATPATPGIVEHAVNAKPNDIVAGPDGNLWFTQTQANTIGRITPAGVVTDFSTGISPGSSPGGIAAGPDNNMWFTEFGADRMGRITTADSAALPPPVEGKSVNATTEAGIVLVKVPAGTTHPKGSPVRGAVSGFVPLSSLGGQIPVGSTLDTRHGTVQIVAAQDSRGGTQDGHFSTGLFVVGQTAGKPLTTITMTGGALNSCSKLPRGGAARQIAGAAGRGRSLFNNVHGHFRTRGRNSVASVRGTEYLVKDTCSGTLTKVTRGVVQVRDFSLRKNVTVKAGHQYFARAPK